MLNFRHIRVLQTLDTVKTVIIFVKTGFEHVKISSSIRQYLKDLGSTANNIAKFSPSGRLNNMYLVALRYKGHGDVIVITSWYIYLLL